MGSNNTILINGTVTRSRKNGGQHDLPLLRELADIKNLLIGEHTIAPAAAGVQIPFGNIANAKGVVLSTDVEITLHLGGVGQVGIKCGSIMFLMDTDLASIHVDGHATLEATVEVWLVKT